MYSVMLLGVCVVYLTRAGHVNVVTLVPAWARPMEVWVLVVVGCQGSFKVILSHVQKRL